VEDAVVILGLRVAAGASTTGAHGEFVMLYGFAGRFGSGSQATIAASDVSSPIVAYLS
jgi:hypothetical protein